MKTVVITAKLEDEIRFIRTLGTIIKTTVYTILIHTTLTAVFY